MDSEKLKKILIQHEGLRLKKYKCSKGKWTLGVGWNLDNKLPSDIAQYFLEHGEITEDMAMRMLDLSLARAIIEAKVMFPQFRSFSDNRQHAIVDLLFNMGMARFSKFRKTVAAIKAGDWDTAALEVVDSEYYRELGGDPPGTDDGREERPEWVARMFREG